MKYLTIKKTVKTNGNQCICQVKNGPFFNYKNYIFFTVFPKYYYYFGLADKMQLNKEILKIKKELQHINFSSLNNYDCLFYKCIENFIKYFENQLSKRHDYRELLKRIQLIKNNYPSVQSFLDDKKISDFSINEQKSILEIIDIQNEISYIEIEEAFKLGQKENSII